MATKADDSAHTPEVVGNTFVEQYYNMLCQDPEEVHKFYQNESVISRPGVGGSMSSASTLDGIDKMILSLDYKNCQVEILTADSQVSMGDGVIVLVTGFFTGKDNLKRKFSQLFFLAPQEESRVYYVMNDVFRYVGGDGLANLEISNDDDSAPAAPVRPDGITNHAVTDPASTPLEEETVKAHHSLDNGKIPAIEKAVVVDHEDGTCQDDTDAVSVNVNQTDAQLVSEFTVSNNQEDAPKKSYASVARDLIAKVQPFQQRVTPAKPVEKSRMAAPPPPVPSPRPAGNDAVEKNSSHIVKGFSIFVANLPMNATPEQLRETFEKFGPIKPDGVQVRSYKQEKNCFGFVEFESETSMQSALKVSSIMIGNRNAHIEEKKANNDGGKYPSRKGSFRNDNFRGRGRGHKNEAENQERNPSHTRSRSGQGWEGNYKNFQNGGGRVARQVQEPQV